MILFLAHLLLMLGIYTRWTARRVAWPADLKVLGALTVTWTSVIYASYGLACFRQINNTSLFLATSLLVQGIICWLLAKNRDVAVEIEKPMRLRGWLKDTFSSWPRRLALLAFCVLGMMVLIMSLRTRLQISDTVAMKLPNAYWYFKTGTLLPDHAFWDEDRSFATPFNGSIWWIYLTRFHQPLRLLTFFNFVCWFLMVIAVYRVCRQVGASRWGSFSAAALFCLSQALLFQGQTDNDDLMSSITAVSAAVFFFLWLRTRRLRDLFVVAFGTGISAGAKFFPALYFPGMFLCFVWFSVKSIREGRKTELKQVTGQLFAAGAIVLSMSVPFFIASRIYSNSEPAMFAKFKNVQNSPFRADVAFHNIVTYNLQFLAGAAVDAVVPESGPTRTQVVSSLNQFSAEHLIPKTDKYWAYAPGVHIAWEDAYEDSVWYGLLALPIAAAMVIVVFRRRCWFSVPFWLVVFFWSWDFFFSSRQKYIEQMGRYWILPVSLCMPLVALLIDRLGKQRTWRIPAKILILALWASTLVCGFIGLYDNPIRLNFKQAITLDLRDPKMPDAYDHVLKSCDRLNILRNIYGYPVYLDLREFTGKEITYRETFSPDRPNIIAGLDLPVLAPYYELKYTTLDLKRPRRGGVQALGANNGIPMYVLPDAGCSCPETCREKEGLLLVQFYPDRRLILGYKDMSTVKVETKILGLQPEDRFSFRAVLKDAKGASKALTDWAAGPQFDFTIPKAPGTLVIEAKEAKVGSEEIYSSSVAILKQ